MNRGDEVSFDHTCLKTDQHSPTGGGGKDQREEMVTNHDRLEECHFATRRSGVISSSV